jgi:hypothetical protein
MIKAFQLIFIPEAVWIKIVARKRGWAYVFFLQLLPVLLVSLAVEAYSLMRWGERRGMFGYLVQLPKDLILRYILTQFALALGVLLLGSWIMKWIAASFDARPPYGNCLIAIAYGLMPFYLLRTLDAVPAVNTWLCYAIAILCSLASLYHGVPRMLMLEQTKSFGVYLLSCLILILLTCSAHFVAVSILD